MVRPGLPPNLSRQRGCPPLAVDAPALRIDVRSSRITEASPALVRILACRSDEIVGRPLAELWVPKERDAIMRRFGDVILLGRAIFGAALLAPEPADPVRVEVDATYDYRCGQCLDVVLSPVVPVVAPAPVGLDPGPGNGARPRTPVAMSTLAMVLPRPAGLGLPIAVVDRRAEAATDSAPALRNGARRIAASATSARRSPVAARLPDHAPMAHPQAAPRLVLDALQLAGAAALRVSADGIVLDATPAVELMLGRPLPALLDRRFDTLLSMSAPAAAALRAARREGSRQSVLSDGAAGRPALVVEWLPGGEPGAGFAVLMTSMPESESAERMRFQSQLVSLVAHDVRDSLAAAYCGLRTVADGLADSDPMRETILRALAESQRAHRIVEDALTMARPGNLIGVELDLDTVVHQAVARYRARALARNIELVERLESGSHVLADFSSLERAFSNLIDNALDAVPQTGRIMVAASREDRGAPGVLITISDTGTGIKEETRPNVFEPFFTDKDGGTGLGLAITRRVVLDHGGQISFESEEGRGTTFHLWLPRIGEGRA